MNSVVQGSNRKVVLGEDLAKQYVYFRVVVKTYDFRDHNYHKGCRHIQKFTQKVDDLYVADFVEKWGTVSLWQTPNLKAWQKAEYDDKFKMLKVIIVLTSMEPFPEVNQNNSSEE